MIQSIRGSEGPVSKTFTPIRDSEKSPNFLIKLIQAILRLFCCFSNEDVKPLHGRVQIKTQKMPDTVTEKTIEKKPAAPTLSYQEIKAYESKLIGYNRTLPKAKAADLNLRVIKEHRDFSIQIKEEMKNNPSNEIRKLSSFLNRYDTCINEAEKRLNAEPKKIARETIAALKKDHLPHLRNQKPTEDQLKSANALIPILETALQNVKGISPLENQLGKAIEEMKILIEAHQLALALEKLNNDLKNTSDRSSDLEQDREVVNNLHTWVASINPEYRTTVATIVNESVRNYLSLGG